MLIRFHLCLKECGRPLHEPYRGGASQAQQCWSFFLLEKNKPQKAHMISKICHTPLRFRPLIKDARTWDPVSHFRE
ncbi:hypothetical protein KIN20_029515 [Parelaphostrongylus tenuis]|uniref:Uncharacterized protein n=1 Tax=Parelaphostrongylus tenuis TaxID=148309 RepID=A0AAD5WFM6_PARTN|nr:hypothetical protein KIN20_029515 [Parelaphostrongylus tenuis]